MSAYGTADRPYTESVRNTIFEVTVVIATATQKRECMVCHESDSTIYSAAWAADHAWNLHSTPVMATAS